MREFKIAELSAVDNPAQGHALMAIMKRGDDAPGETLSSIIAKRYIDPMEGAKSFTEVLQHELEEKRYYAVMEEVQPAIYALECSLRSIAGDRDMDSDGKQNMLRNSVEDFLAAIRQRWPDVEQALMKNFSGNGAGDGGRNEGADAMTDAEKKQLTELQKNVADLTKKLEAATADDAAKKAAELQGSLDEASANLEEANKKLETAEAEKAEAVAKARMTDDEREYMGTLGKEEQGKFLAMSADDRKKAMKKSLDGDETLEVAGRMIRKSVVGEDQFEIFKAQQEEMAKQEARIAKQDEEIAKERDRRETAELMKRAEDELAHLPGKVEDQVSVLRAIAKMEDGPREVLETMLKSGDKAVSAAFDKIGHRGGELSADGAAFQKRISDIRARDKCSRTEAMQKAREEHPEEFAAYQSDGQAAN